MPQTSADELNFLLAIVDNSPEYHNFSTNRLIYSKQNLYEYRTALIEFGQNQKKALANRVSFVQSNKSCGKCKSAGRREAIWTSHNASECRIEEIMAKHGKTLTANKAVTPYFILDSGANYSLVNFRPTDFVSEQGKVTVANNAQVDIAGRGTIDFYGFNLPVKYVPNLCHSLLSVGSLTELGCIVKFTSVGANIYNGDTLVATIQRDSDLLYKIQALSTINKSTNHISNVNTQPQNHLVGAREVGPIQMREIGVFSDALAAGAHHKRLITTPTSLGEPSGERSMAIQGSGRQGTPNSTNQLHIEPLGRIYADYQGPFPLAGTDGTFGNVKFIDHNTGYFGTYNIISKSSENILVSFKYFQLHVEQLSGYKIKSVVTDQGTEFKGLFAKYLDKEGILHFCGPAYNHSYVGKVEKAHRDILDMARVMLNNSQLPRRFYSDAIQYSTYMRNRTPGRNLSLTPVEL